MSAAEFVLGKNETLKLNVERKTAVPVHRGNVRPLRLNVPKDRLAKAGGVVPLEDEGDATITAHAPTLLELYREDPIAVRQEIERRVHRARNEEIRAFLARFFSAPGAR